MSEFPERLWHDFDEQPGCEITYDGETYHLCWQNTWVQRYRTGNEDIDLQLIKYDHVLHRYAKREDEDDADNIIFDYIIFPFDRLDPKILEFLTENHYPNYTNPIVDRYYRDHMEQQPGNIIPDAIGPEFGASAA